MQTDSRTNCNANGEDQKNISLGREVQRKLIITAATQLTDMHIFSWIIQTSLNFVRREKNVNKYQI